ncbi:NADPH-dependent ferric siderophore reductase, contains FAD-binding and SIP domains [Phyllobacterium sp. CL33Tsu]|uniref:siderophore-interacting protein n=1 Tax=Phyllobacterium sp. CL33Tsu TaxID=1798191 RepID=UPI0008EC3AD9|nr:siderophore-interacting protein [Phyllobacterium sp. CL33Tsu]SFJ26965.1 NADPH-dependent ferric siderophore reductase, contains FAD-binding and SIP domains [Phyllobacterium sp. CL33Tsu]
MPDTILRASARIALTNPALHLNKLLDHFSEHGDVTRRREGGTIGLTYGKADLAADGDSLSLTAEGEDETGLAYMKYALANHVLEFARAERPRIVWEGDGAVGSVPPFFREMRVVESRNVSPRMRRVTLRGNNLARFQYGGLHVHLLFPPNGVAQPRWPVMGEDGRPEWPEGSDKLVSRVYTIRKIDAARGEVDIDIVIHDGTPGSQWALNAMPGDLVGMTGPGGGDVGVADWYLLAGDETALPAIGRILERLPATAKIVVRIEVEDEADEQNLTAACDLDLVWLHRSGAAAATTDLLPEAVAKVVFPTDVRVFVWAGCEFSAFKSIRNHVRKERKLAREEHLVVSYWRRGHEG